MWVLLESFSFFIKNIFDRTPGRHSLFERKQMTNQEALKKMMREYRIPIFLIQTLVFVSPVFF